MSALKKIPVFIVLPQFNSNFEDIFISFQNSGAQPVLIIHTFPISNEIKERFSIPFRQCRNEEIPKVIAAFIIEKTKTDSEFDQLIVFENDKSMLSSEILSSVYIASFDTEAFYIFETNDVIKSEKNAELFLMERIVGEKLDEPNPFLWFVPRKACEILAKDPHLSRTFPLSWLHEIHKAEIPIHSAFLNSNDTSIIHRNPFGLYRIAMFSLGLFLRFALSSLTASIADNLVFFLLNLFGVSNFISLVFGRLISLLVNYVLLRLVVFKEKGRQTGSFFRYIILVIFSGGIVYFGIQWMTEHTTMNSVLAKILLESVMFFFNFIVSKAVVFRHSKTKPSQSVIE